LIALLHDATELSKRRETLSAKKYAAAGWPGRIVDEQLRTSEATGAVIGSR